jgi:putative NIF3 family GTP cyclohydrolase 1 type 2
MGVSPVSEIAEHGRDAHATEERHKSATDGASGATMTYTVKDIIQTITSAVPTFRPDRTCDTIKAGSLDELVRGVAVTFVTSRAVLNKAVEIGANLVITHEPTYYNDERYAELANDSIVAAKKKFIDDHKLTIWRCHDSWHQLQPDGILTGMARQFGWQQFQRGDQRVLFDLPGTTLEKLMEQMKQKLGGPVLRFIGDPQMPVKRIAYSCGCPSWDTHRTMLNLPEVDVLVCGELREWETCEYVRDGIVAGRNQGLVVLGHCNSEEGGMQYLTEWLRERISGVKIDLVPAGDPFRYR